MKYFHYIPKVEYSENLATNVMVRGKIRELVKQRSSVFYDYTVSDGERPDILVEETYGSSDVTWVLYYINDIYDPIHGWVLFENEFMDYMHERYNNGESIINFSANLYFDAADSSINTTDPTEIETISQLKSHRYMQVTGSDGSVNDGSFYIKGITISNISAKIFIEPAANIQLNFSNKIISQAANLNGAQVSISYEQSQRVIKNLKNSIGLIIDKETFLSLPSNQRSYESVWEWERQLNENKRSIKLLERRYLAQILREISELFN